MGKNTSGDICTVLPWNIRLVEKGVPVFVVKGEDEYRAQDTRVENFLKKIGHEDAVVIDLAEFALDGVDKEFRPIYSPMITTSTFNRQNGKLL